MTVKNAQHEASMMCRNVRLLHHNEIVWKDWYRTKHVQNFLSTFAEKYKFMAEKNSVDMTHGPLLGKILCFALPFAASGIMEQLFVTIDVAVVGRFATSEALAAVGANTFLINLLINLFMGISVGANAVISNFIGRNDRHRVRDAVGTAMMLPFFASVLLLVFGEIFAPRLLLLMGTPLSILEKATLFLRVYFLGIPFYMIFTFGQAVLRGKGDTQRPLKILLIAGCINVALNLLFVIVFKLGVAGVGCATGCANIFSAFSIVWILRREQGPFRLTWKRLRVEKSALKQILFIGIPAGLQGMVFSLSNIFVQSAINSYGPSAIAGAAISQNFDTYCYFLITSFCGAAVTFTGQNYGAGKLDRCRRVFWICMGCGALACFLGNMLFYTQSDFFLWFFTTDPSVIQYAKARMSIVLVFQALAASYEISAASMRGLGHSIEPTLLTIFGTCVLRFFWVFFICPVWPGFRELMLCYPISWILTGIMVCACYVFVSRKAYRKIHG